MTYKHNHAWPLIGGFIIKKFGRKIRKYSIPRHDSIIRSEIFSAERLEQHAESLALSHKVAARPPRTHLLEKRLRENDLLLRDIYQKIGKAIEESSELPPAAEWLVDNYFVLEEQIRDIRNDLPPKYYLQLPKLKDGYLAGYPRVYGIAWAYIAHTDSFFNAAFLKRFISAYQRKQPLNIGELWAVAITLRIALVENLRRAAILVIEDRQARAEADLLADRLLAYVDEDISTIEEELKHLDRATLSSAFSVQLIQRLRDQDSRVLPFLKSLDDRLKTEGTSAEEIVRVEHQNQGALTITVRNIITSMRALSTFNWTEFFESVSLVDEKLGAQSHFNAMDLPTRNLYRHAIERLAQRSRLSELEIAEAALKAIATVKEGYAGSKQPSDMVDLERLQDPGYYLVDKGLPLFEKTIGYRPPWRERIGRMSSAVHFVAYIMANILLVSCIVKIGLGKSVFPTHSPWVLASLSCAAFFPAWEAAITLINRFVISLFVPSILPGLALREGIPEDLRTMVVVPTLLSSMQEIEAQVQQLEVHYLSNVDGDLTFALLSDWKDADSETQLGDSEQLAVAKAAIRNLNQRHALLDGHARFYLFHRHRVWNPQQRKWMGWERKRGKLYEFNRLLREAEDTTFVLDHDNPHDKPPKNVRFVITLDGDTRLPRGTVKRLVGKMAHPLNHARVDPATRYVREGYGILQPRVASSLPHDQTNSFFQRVFYSASGIDPYAFAISDVYQDLFEEGSFTGKGIYDVDAFQQSVSGRIPENAVLSHDLLEGIFARAGLASDIEVVEEFPSRYDVASSRQHRWARGDWQLLPWIFGRFSDGIPTLGHWKMVDNLRRTFTAPFAFLALLIGWSFPIGAASLWTALIIVTLSTPLLLGFLEGLWPRHASSKSSHALMIGKDAIRTCEQVALMVTFLPHQAWLMMDAIFRTLWRLNISRRNLLEWVTAAETKVSEHRSIPDFYRYMSGSLLLILIASVCLLLVQSAMWMVAAPFMVLWLFAPAIAQIASQPAPSLRQKPLDETERKSFRLIARATWRFFTHFVTAEDNFLPPDNFQEDPFPVVAHRTSPTNIGVYLLSIIAAQDFGWTGLTESLGRLSSTLHVLRDIEKFRGHLFNWYDTRQLRPLLPRYISSVDSGNLAGYLIIIKQFCVNTISQPVINADWLAGLSDVVELTGQSFKKIPQNSEYATRRQLDESLSSLKALIGRAETLPPTLQCAYSTLNEVEIQTSTIADLTSTLHAEMGSKAEALTSNIMHWGRELRLAAQGYRKDLDRFTPWLDVIFKAPKNYDSAPQPLMALLTGSFPTLGGIPELLIEARRFIEAYASEAADNAHQLWSTPLLHAIQQGAEAAQVDLERWKDLGQLAFQLFTEMDFTFLLDETRHLLSIGYRVDDNALDPSHYDLLASEARLASIVAIAKGDISAQNWFHLGRTITSVNYRSVLVSWSGSMFEYLMPTLVMSEPDESLIGQTNRLVVRRQIQYGTERGVPWGVSESAYNARDFEFTYQYSSFGVPGLGLKRGLSENIVVAPYASALAAMINPQAALKNLQHMEEMGGRGIYGWYEAFDFTSKRLPEGEKHAIVRAYMAHHQGMSLIALLNVLQNGRMRQRFHAEPIIQATELLLQELPPRNVALAHPRSEEVASVAHIREIIPPDPRVFRTPHTIMPRTTLMSNGNYAVMLTAAGSGYSLWRDLAVTRWREDPTRDCWGSFIYMRDAQSGKLWSATYQPVCVEPEKYNVAFFEDHAEFNRQDGGINTTLNVVVSSEDHGEVRRLTIINQSDESHDLELTSYAELVLTQQASDIAHPSFNKLFVQTEFIPEANALLATRRLRSPDEKPVWAVHLVSIGGEVIGNIQYETDRARFLGRGRTPRNPQAVDGRPLNDTVGTVLDPIFSLRCRVRIAAGATAHVAFWTLTTSTREEALDLADKYRAPSAYHRASARAWTQAQLQYQHLGMTPEEAHLFQRLANHVLYSDRALRPTGEILKRGAGAQSLLWSAGISGDVPIVLMRIDVASDLKTLRQMVRAYSYWSIKRLDVDLVILNEQPTSYLENLQNEIELLVRTNQALPGIRTEGAKGGIFLLRGDRISDEARALLLTVARAVIVGHRGSLADQLTFQLRDELIPYTPQPRRFVPKSPVTSVKRPTLEFFNGIGGFSNQGREYVVILEPGQFTPAPWINVIANPNFGFHVSCEGAGYSWAVNSREYKLTPWSNDPVSDEASEIIYLRDLDNGAVWTPTATPIRKDGMTYIARHGFGYSQFETSCYGIDSTLTQYVPLQGSIKISRLVLQNTTLTTRRMSVSSYTEWVLGPSRSAANLVITEMDSETNAMLAYNPWSNEFGSRTAFVHMSGSGVSYTADRNEFIGRNGALHHPSALNRRTYLSGKVGAGLDPCAVLQRTIEIRPRQKIEIIVLLGEGTTDADAKQLLETYRKTDLDKTLLNVKIFWNDMLGQVQIRTPDRAMDIMQNGWLMYQTIVCRIWARSAFYQSSGAYGYRDQLQDTMAVTLHRPSWTREHLLRAAGRQFPEGDVQHWWLPSEKDAGRGVRTRFSDDPLWLCYITAYYVKVTGDTGILDEQVPFLHGPILKDDEHESFFMPERSEQTATLFEHCALAMDQRLKTGVHGISLFGGGDWNDGMNRVGVKGTGESVWLAWFLLTVIKDFTVLSNKRDAARTENWHLHAVDLKAALEKDGWDGEWYRRGFYDDGTALGSASSTECRIDSIAQSWAVISGAADPEHQMRGMKAMEQYLIKPDEGLALLFTPPFDHTPLDPGYIKGYPPGVRENGGQYTHAALWSVIAFNQLGQGDKAFALFNMLNPIQHASSRASSYRYKVEPYVVAADIYSNAQHIGRGGWTWYTGSSGWMYRTGMESILGFNVEGSNLRIDPCIPKNWPGFEITYRYKSTTYLIRVENQAAVNSGISMIELDGKSLGENSSLVPLVDDKAEHSVRIVMGTK